MVCLIVSFSLFALNTEMKRKILNLIRAANVASHIQNVIVDCLVEIALRIRNNAKPESDLIACLLFRMFLVVFSCLFILLSRESDQSTITILLRSCRPSVYHGKIEESRYLPFPTALQINLPACCPSCPFNAERQRGKVGIPLLKSMV